MKQTFSIKVPQYHMIWSVMMASGPTVWHCCRGTPNSAPLGMSQPCCVVCMLNLLVHRCRQHSCCKHFIWSSTSAVTIQRKLQQNVRSR